MRLLDRRNSELKQIKEDLNRAHANVESLRSDKGMEREAIPTTYDMDTDTDAMP